MCASGHCCTQPLCFPGSVEAEPACAVAQILIWLSSPDQALVSNFRLCCHFLAAVGKSTVHVSHTCIHTSAAPPGLRGSQQSATMHGYLWGFPVQHRLQSHRRQIGVTSMCTGQLHSNQELELAWCFGTHKKRPLGSVGDESAHKLGCPASNPAWPCTARTSESYQTCMYTGLPYLE